MAGGLLNLVSVGNSNILLTGNPSISFFKATYSKYHNFGIQKFRLDVLGSRNLRLTQESLFTFDILRYGDLISETYFVVTLPNIWSTIIQYDLNESNLSENQINQKFLITTNNDQIIEIEDKIKRNVYPYEFKWIENLGSQIIKKVRIIIGNQVLTEFSGQYLLSMVQRDFSKEKKKLYDEMTGNTKELNDVC